MGISGGKWELVLTRYGGDPDIVIRDRLARLRQFRFDLAIALGSVPVGKEQGGDPQQLPDIRELFGAALRPSVAVMQLAKNYPGRNNGSVLEALLHRERRQSRRSCPGGHYQPWSLICSHPSSITLSSSTASSGERHPKMRSRALSRSAAYAGLSRWMKSAAVSSLSGGSALRSSMMDSRFIVSKLPLICCGRQPAPNAEYQ